MIWSKHIDKIRVRDIYDTAGFSANTFYYHFKDKYDCACLLMKVYETRWHPDFTGDLEKYYTEYIENGAFLNRYLTEIPEPLSYREYLQQAIELEYSRTHDAVAFWRKNHHIFKNIFLSYAPNSPFHEHKAAWITWYKNMLTPLLKNDSELLEYLASVLFENHISFWKTCILAEDPALIDVEYFTAIAKKIMFSVIDFEKQL